MNVDLRHGDCVELMRAMPDCSVDSIVTDPPYELAFMGRRWDASGIAYSLEMWGEALRVLKPGGHLLAFGGTRTYHRMACAIEDAGFEIRDSIHWVYGSGFPKSLNIGKAIDKAAGAERVSRKWDSSDSTFGKAAGFTTRKCLECGKFAGSAEANCHCKDQSAVTPEAARWEGWGTALKPAHEPIVVARKPLESTVAGNVLVWGTGGLNIDGCRVGTDGGGGNCAGGEDCHCATDGRAYSPTKHPVKAEGPQGRWPANVVFDRTAGEALDQQSGTLATNKPVKWKRERETAEGRRVASSYAFTPFESGEIRSAYSDSGGASRFFTQADFGPDDWPFVYQAKPSRKERNAGLDGLPEKRPDDRTTTGMGTFEEKGVAKQSNHHPTVKPVALMRHLVRLVTPPGGTVLDPFAGSGTTLVAAVLEGFDAIGCEMTDEYLPIIEGRVAWAEEQAFIREELDKLTPKQERLL
jgi:DNA modification methylase